MKRFLSTLLQSLALSLLLAHSVLPHKHHQQLSASEHCQQHCNAQSFLDYLTIAFHADLGKGHLESFLDERPTLAIDAAKKAVSEAQLAIFIRPLPAFLPTQAKLSQRSTPFPTTQAHFLNPQLALGKPLRAPPVIG